MFVISKQSQWGRMFLFNSTGLQMDGKTKFAKADATLKEETATKFATHEEAAEWFAWASQWVKRAEWKIEAI